MPSGIALHTEDRILLYLSNFGSLEEVYEAESDLTQKEIAINVKVQRKHVSRYLKKLMEDGMIDEKVCHVKGAKQRMRCYSLTGPGKSKAKEIVQHVGSQNILVKINGVTKEMLVSEIDGATSVHLTLSDIVAEAMDAVDVLLMKNLESVEENRRRMMDEKTHRAEAYRNALGVAWRNGILTTSEKHLIDALKDHLGVSDEEHKSMETKIINDIPKQDAHVDLYEEILNMMDSKPTSREEKILELLRGRLERD